MLVRFARGTRAREEMSRVRPKESWDVESLGVSPCAQHSCDLALALGT